MSKFKLYNLYRGQGKEVCTGKVNFNEHVLIISVQEAIINLHYFYIKNIKNVIDNQHQYL